MDIRAGPRGVSGTALNPDGSGDILEFTRLCSPQWIIEHGCKVGATIHANLDELKFSGEITITSMGPCPRIQQGKGRVVTMTVTHLNGYVWEIEVMSADKAGRVTTETLCPTDVHKLFSATRNDWVMTKDLSIGEHLRTQHGIAAVISVRPLPGVHRLYNFEVEKTHQYFVGNSRTLSHNTECPVTSTGSSGGVGPEAWTHGNQPPIIYRGGTPSPSNLVARPGESAVSFRNTLSNPIPKEPKPVFKLGGDWFAIDTAKLPPGSVVFDNLPPGHVSVKGVPAEVMKNAVCKRGKFPKGLGE